MSIIAVVSDVHLGTTHDPGVQGVDREQFMAFLRALGDEDRDDYLRDVSTLVLNGDIDDLWRRSVRSLTRENHDFYSLLHKLRTRDRNKLKIHYIRGNHDHYAAQDRASRRLSEMNAEYYDTEHQVRRVLQTNGTTYEFNHGYIFDEFIMQFEWAFDGLALITGDASGATLSQTYALATTIKGKFPLAKMAIRRARNRYKYGRWKKRIALIDDLEPPRGSNVEEKIAPKNAVNHVRNTPGIDWLCIGHTHVAGLKPEERVANSGAWAHELGEVGQPADTFLLLSEEPSLWRWNEGSPIKLDGPDPEV